MSMEISGEYGRAAVDYAEQRKARSKPEEAGEGKEPEEAKRAKEAGKEGAGKRKSGRLPELRDEYISSEKSERKPTGLYRVSQDENGNRKICFDDPNKARCGKGKDDPEAEGDTPKENAVGKEPKADGKTQGESKEKCVGNTDKVEREIRKLKEKKQQLEQQIQSASGDERKLKELKKKLTQVEQELARKDNDTYRRQQTVFS